MKFYKDFVELMCKNFLTGADLETYSKDQLRGEIGKFYNRQIKIIPQRKWRVEKSSSLENNLTNEQIDAINKIIVKAQNGEDLSPYCSCNLYNPKKYDKLLFDWSIYHLHLGHSTTVAKEVGFVNRTGELLFALRSSNVLYLIAVMNHASFNELELVSIIKKEWEHLLEPYEATFSQLNYEISDSKEVKQLRTSGLNYAVNIDGTNYSSRGGGYTVSGPSSVASDFTIYICNALDSLEVLTVKECEDRKKNKEKCKLIKVYEEETSDFSSNGIKQKKIKTVFVVECEGETFGISIKASMLSLIERV